MVDRTRLSVMGYTQSRERSIVQYSIDDWDLESILSFDSSQANLATEQSQWYGDRIIVRPRGVANSGRLVTRIETSGLECLTRVHVVEVLPSFIYPLWDTWTLLEMVNPLISAQSDGTIVVEWDVALPPGGSLEVSLDYEPVLLPFQQFPADPNRGMELPPTQFFFSAECATDPATLICGFRPNFEIPIQKIPL